jgi:hypothetical protein
MLVALLAGLLFFGMRGDGVALRLFAEDMQKSVNEVVADKTRAAAAEKLFEQGRKDVEDFSKNLEKLTKDFRAADENHSAGLDVLTPIVEQAIAARRSGQATVLDRVFALRGTLTETEWQAAFARLDEKK